jgi:phosphohistidine phosphatase
MKRIILMRHGQAEVGSDGMSDFERSLTAKGRNVSRLMARKLRGKIKDPGILVTSPAFRALETAIIFAREYGISPEKIILKNSIYSKFDHSALMEILKETAEEVDTITLFGHNPTFTDIASWFSMEPVNMIPKSGIVCLSFGLKLWSELKPATARPEICFEPKKIL